MGGGNMLKRYQILLNDWLATHIKSIAEKYDMSFSEVIRALLCLQVIQLVEKIYPKYKHNVPQLEVRSIIKKRKENKLEQEDLHRFISTLYFEGRKSMEFWELQEEKLKK